MYANYHTHTPRCRHAIGAEREYVEAALAAGLQVLGFSDHTPQFFPGGYYSGYRMRPEQLADYCATVLALKAEYAGRIRLHLGLEVEYYPALFPQLLAALRQTPVEYIILGQHALDNEEQQIYSGTPTCSAAHLRRYVDQCIAGMRTGLFTYLAHPDLINYVGGDGALYTAEMTRLCRAAKACAVPLEINLLGLAEGRNYPDERFWQIAGQVGNTAVLGCDAHEPQALCRPQVAAAGAALAARYGLPLLDTVPLRPLA